MNFLFSKIFDGIKIDFFLMLGGSSDAAELIQERQCHICGNVLNWVA